MDSVWFQTLERSGRNSLGQAFSSLTRSFRTLWREWCWPLTEPEHRLASIKEMCHRDAWRRHMSFRVNNSPLSHSKGACIYLHDTQSLSDCREGLLRLGSSCSSSIWTMHSWLMERVSCFFKNIWSPCVHSFMRATCGSDVCKACIQGQRRSFLVSVLGAMSRSILKLIMTT